MHDSSDDELVSRTPSNFFPAARAQGAPNIAQLRECQPLWALSELLGELEDAACEANSGLRALPESLPEEALAIMW
jgi:hypothetical protein